MLTTMCKCQNCGELFHEFEIVRYRERHGEVLSGSPCCMDSWDEVEVCDFCGTELSNDDDNFDDEGNYICPECGSVGR